jgi:putative FmdB family regulatory protein
MPTYEYLCPKCNLRFELKRPFSESGEDAPCPQCHTSAKRVFSTLSIVAKDGYGLPFSISDKPGSGGLLGGKK